MTAMIGYKQKVPLTTLCNAMSIARATLYRFTKPQTAQLTLAPMIPALAHPRALRARVKIKSHFNVEHSEV